MNSFLNVRPSDILIPLTRDHFAIVSGADAYLLDYLWHLHDDGKGKLYARSKVMGYMHRHITDARMGMVADHWNGNGLDNRRRNLRVCTHKQNCVNTMFWGAVEFRGIDEPRPGRFRARIMPPDGEKRINLGVYDTPEEAAKVYDAAALEMFGQFAWINFRNVEAIDPEPQEIPF